MRSTTQSGKRIRGIFCSGFTLIELLVTVLLLGVLFGLAVPGFQSLLNQVRYNRSSDTLVETLTAARNEAVFNGKQIVVCAAVDPGAAEPVCSGNQTDWSGGWIVFEDCTGDNTRQSSGNHCDLIPDPGNNPESPEPVLKTFMPSSYTITNDRNSSGVGSVVTFAASGTSNGGVDFEINIDGRTGNVSVSSLARIESVHASY